MNAYQSMIDSARNILSKNHPRAGYADDVLRGAQAWSGADLKGKARKFGASYAGQRRYARQALIAAGGVLVAIKQTGRLISALYVGQDDFGAAVYVSAKGPLIIGTDIR